jgi:hypothetical protein
MDVPRDVEQSTIYPLRLCQNDKGFYQASSPMQDGQLVQDL